MRTSPRTRTTAATRAPSSGGRVIRLTRDQGRPTASGAFTWVYIALSCWMVFGAYLDAWAHIHIAEVETFFTPWHAVLYSGFLAVALVTVGTLVRNHRRGSTWTRALPPGYELSLSGVVIFLAGGVGDMIWHTLFGIEVGVDALLSPTHLLLALGAVLIGTGPLRAGWHRIEAGDRGHDWTDQLPVIISLALFLSVLTYFSQYA